MLQRCQNPKDIGHYPRYGARGITVCDPWQDFVVFLFWAHESGYEKSLTLDRIDNNGNYEPSNCKWSTPLEQGANKRNNIWVEHNGENLTLSAWAQRLGTTARRIWQRINLQGWTVEQAVTIPVGGRR